MSGGMLAAELSTFKTLEGSSFSWPLSKQIKGR
jgi:hypothetical protein